MLLPWSNHVVHVGMSVEQYLYLSAFHVPGHLFLQTEGSRGTVGPLLVMDMGYAIGSRTNRGFGLTGQRVDDGGLISRTH